MNLKVHPTPFLSGVAAIPGSKSQTVRALILSLLARGKSRIENLLSADDTNEALRVCAQLGAFINRSGDCCTVQTSGLPLETTATALHTGNSGITTRFVLPLLGLRRNARTPIILDCGDQMRVRPIHPLVVALRQLGMQIEYTAAEGKLPLSISGVLTGGMTTVEGITSQYTSALLLSLPCAPQDSVVTVTDLRERPYVEMTLQWLRNLGIQFRHEQVGSNDRFHVPGRQHYPALSVSIAGDFSSASYPIAATALLSGEVTLQGLDMTEPQGDKRLVEILQKMGADITVHTRAITIRGGRVLRGVRIDASDIPDLLPTLAVIGTQAQGTTEIVNVKQARIKETDRIHSMCEGLRMMGAEIKARGNGLVVRHSVLRGAHVKGYGDHRTVMALALAGMCADGETVVSDAEAVAKTFPNYAPFMASLGAQMTVETHVILMGFKHVGKSVIGRALAKKLDLPYYELDEAIESLHKTRTGQTASCREIVAVHGEDHFCALESDALAETLQRPAGVVSLGGGAVMRDVNRPLIQAHIPVHITAPQDIVRKRVTDAGWPQVARFDKIWSERERVYRELARMTVDNSGSMDDTVQKITAQMK